MKITEFIEYLNDLKLNDNKFLSFEDVEWLIQQEENNVKISIDGVDCKIIQNSKDSGHACIIHNGEIFVIIDTVGGKEEFYDLNKRDIRIDFLQYAFGADEQISVEDLDFEYKGNKNG